MENYVVSARKYRPKNFASVVGQEALTHTLKSAIDSGRLAHAYLFCGPRGVGKTTCARIFAKTINCLNPRPDGEACCECESCKAFEEQRSYNIVELDAASNNSVDDIRNLTDQVRIPPQIGKYRVFIIDEVHMLSTAAFNAFLKTLEEPPAHAIFILATTEKQKIIPTILSRCQIYDFSRITVNDIIKQLETIAADQHITYEPAALNVIAQKADGAMRDALSIFDQVAASSEGNITYQSALDNLNVLDYDYYFRLDAAFLACDIPQTLLIYKEIRDKGFDSQFFINGLAGHIRSLMVASTPATKVLLETSEDVANRYVTESTKFSPRFYYHALELCNKCDLNYRIATNKQFLVELTLIKICQLLDTTTPPEGGGKETLKKITPAQQASQPTQQAQTTATPSAATPPTPTAAAPAPTDTPTPTVTQEAPSPSYTAAKTVAVSMPRILINAEPKATSEANPAKPEKKSSTTLRREPFTQESLLSAWNQFIADHPTQHVIISTMQVSQPKKINDTLYEISVDSEAQVEFFNAHKGEIIRYLRDRVNNDMLAIEVKITEGERAPRILSPQDIVADMVDRNPEIKKLIQTFHLGLD